MDAGESLSFEQVSVAAVLSVTMALFIWGRWRYDVVAVCALLASVALGVVEADSAFAGFGHPAVITVAAVLIISQSLQHSGVADSLARHLLLSRGSTTMQIGAITGLTAALSAFMNNVGALALMLPVALRNAERLKISPSLLLMPLAFASLLGGLVTLIGTPPNIVIAAARAQASGEAFGMFDFTPVGLIVAIAGLVYLVLIGWRLVPRQPARGAHEETGERLRGYLTEAVLVHGSDLEGASVRELERRTEREITVMAVLRGERRILAPANDERLQAEDILILQGDPAMLVPLLDGGELSRFMDRPSVFDDVHSEDVQITEAVVMPRAAVDGQSARAIGMHERFGVNLLALSRSGHAPVARLARIRLRVGDVLLMQGEREALSRALPELGCLALASRGLRLTPQRRSMAPGLIFAAAILAAAAGWIPVQLAFVGAVAAIVLGGALPLRLLYTSVEWPVIVLLGALIPIGEALQATGGTQLLGNALVAVAGDLPPWGLLGVLMLSAMLLSDLVHNTPTAVLMAPVAIAVADAVALSPDPFLMAVAVGAASPYLTPVGHQSNTLVMAPGGYRFSDYWRVGLPMDILILCVGVWAIDLFWM